MTAHAFKASNITTSSATLTLSGYAGGWSVQLTPQRCVTSFSIYTQNASSLSPATTYTYHAYGGSGCVGTPLASVTVLTLLAQVSSVAAERATRHWLSPGRRSAASR